MKNRFLSFGFWLLSVPLFAQIPEYERKAAIISAITGYIKWPPSILTDETPLVVGILGTDPFGELLLYQLQDKYKGRKITINYSTTVSRLQGAHIIFIANSEKNDIARIIKEIYSYKQPSVLTIGDKIPNFCESGGIINFIGEGNGFDFNLLKATKVSLVVDKSISRTARNLVNVE